MEEHFQAKYPKSADDSDAVYRSVIRAKALDTLRGLLPAATTSNVGLFGTGQAYEALLLRMFAHPLDEVRAHARLILHELRQVMPAFVARVDQPDRGGRWSAYLAEAKRTIDATATRLLVDVALRASRRGHPHGLRSRRRGQGGCGGPVCLVTPAGRSAAGDRQAADNRRADRGLAGLLRRARKPSPQAGTRLRAHALPLRRPRRLRGVPRPAAPSAADAGMAGADAASRLRRAGGDRGGGGSRGTGGR